MNDYILDNELGDAADYPLASLGKRFANYVVDYVAALVTTMGIFLLIFVVSDSTGNAMLESDGGIMLNIVAIAAFLSYYIVFETFANGKTLGKLLTKTRAVKTDRSVMTAGDVFKRSLSRMVPFEPFSFFFDSNARGWHDKWSDTVVVDESN